MSLLGFGFNTDETSAISVISLVKRRKCAVCCLLIDLRISFSSLNRANCSFICQYSPSISVNSSCKSANNFSCVVESLNKLFICSANCCTISDAYGSSILLSF